LNGAMSTPELLLLRALWVLDARGRIVAAREPGAPRGPFFRYRAPGWVRMGRIAYASKWNVRALTLR
jgi:hypothetical protein